VGGCGGGDDDSATTSGDDPSVTNSDDSASASTNGTTASSSRVETTADELEVALLTPEEVGSGWHSEGAQPLEFGGGGATFDPRCPTGTGFAIPTVAMFIDFEAPEFGDNTISEAVLTFDTGEDRDTWTTALESCVGQRWEESDDSVEHVSLETIDVAGVGGDSAGFLFHFAHGADEDPAHDSRWFLVPVGDALVLVTGEDYELESSEDEELLADVLARAVDKAEATLQS
jgi:hypothetical protein